VNTTPSVWLLGWLMLGGFTTTAVCIVQALRQAALVP
jgi:hypothetical protein